MPQVIIGYAVSAAVASVTSATIAGVALSTIAGAVASFAYSSSVASSQANKARAAAGEQQAAADSQARSAQRASFNASLRDVTMVLDNPILPRKVILGQTRTSGPLWPWFTGGTQGQDHTFAIILAAHECEAIDKIYFNEDEVQLDEFGRVVGPAKYVSVRQGPLFGITKHLGGPGQVASGALVSRAASSGNSWDATRIGQGLCYIVVTMNAEFDTLGDIGVPSVSALVRGVNQALDPRTGLRGYTTNPALLANWFITDCPYSPATLASEVNTAELIASANVCDELVDFSASRNEKRYTCNGAISCADLPLTNLNHILDSMDGDAVYISGQWQIMAGYYKTPTLALTEDDLSESSITIAPYTPKADLFNTIGGTHFSASNNYTSPISYADVSSSVYVAEDGGEVLPQSIDFALVDDAIRCQMIAWQRLARARNGATISLGTNMRGYDTSPGRNVTIRARELLGDTPKVYTVMRRTLDVPRLTYLLQETGPEVWNWDYSQAQAAVDIPNTSFPDAFTVPTPGAPAIAESLYQTTGSTGVRARASVTWAAVDNVLVSAYLLEYKLASAVLWTQAPAVSAARFDIDDLAAGLYTFRLRCETGSGRRGAYGAVTTKEILGLTAQPAAVSGFTVIAIAGRALASWALHPDLDVRIGGRIVVRHTPLTTGATWEQGVVFDEFNGDAVNGGLPLITGTYMVKAQDSSGNYSASMASWVATEAQVTGFTTVATQAFHPEFLGTKTNTGVVDARLQLISTELFDAAEDFDSDEDLDGGNIAAAGECEFTQIIDLTTVKVRRLQANVQAISFDVADFFDADEDFDDPADFDGAAINDCDATIYLATTPDNPAGSPVWSAWQPFFAGDFNARAYKFRAGLASGLESHNIAISNLTITAREAA